MAAVASVLLPVDPWRGRVVANQGWASARPASVTIVLDALCTGRLRARPLHPDDAAAWAALLNAIEAVDRTGEVYEPASALEELTDPRVDLADSLLVLDAGRPVASAMLRPIGETVVMEAGVHPDHRHRGIGAALVRHAQERAGGSPLHVRLDDRDPGRSGLARAFGMVALRHWAELERDLAVPVAEVAVPAGLVLTPLEPGYDAARWDEPLRRARNAAFAQHWGSVPESADLFAHGRTGSRRFRPGCSAVVGEPGGPIAGFVLAYEEQPGELYVGTVGTVAAYRGRGIAGALLAWTLQRALAAGYTSSALMVDTQNASGALGVYTRVGYTERRRDTTWLVPLA